MNLDNHFNLSPVAIPGETWNDIEGFNGHYSFSNYGRVRSTKNKKYKILTQKISISNRKVQFKVGLTRKTSNIYNKSEFEVVQVLVATYPVEELSRMKSDNAKDVLEKRNFIRSISIHAIPKGDELLDFLANDFLATKRTLPFVEYVKVYFPNSTDTRSEYKQINVGAFKEYVQKLKNPNLTLEDFLVYFTNNKITYIFLD